jgi:ribose/xylose/arabinose/galactoside ABC-type transport system permease subunit
MGNTSAIILLVLLLLCVFFVSGFATGSTISQLILEISIYGLIAVGLSLVMMAGSIDLSVGYLMGCCAVAIVSVYNATGSVLASVVVGLLVGALLGVVNGFFVTIIGINPMIATIALCYIYNGIVLRSTNESSLRTADMGLRDVVYSANIGGVSFLNVTVILFILIIVVLGVFLRKTTLGNNLFISGGNADAGRLSGVDPKKYLFAAYVLCGLCCAVAGLFLSARFGGASYSLGAGRDVFAISACVIGGIKMSGGSGSMSKVLIGIIIMRLISTAMNCMLIPTAWTDFVSGALLLVILIFGRLSTGFDKEL